MVIVTKLKSAATILREAWLLPRVPPNGTIFRNMRLLADSSPDKPRGLYHYLKKYPSLSRIVIDQDWTRDDVSGEMRLSYSNSMFASGCLRMRPGKNKNAAIVFLPGNLSGADSVFGIENSPQNMTPVAEKFGMGLACWDWPLQGRRRDRCLYQGLRSLYSGEREYSRILPAMGTSLWREYVAELGFALVQICRLLGPERTVHVIGWSMGGCFAYLAPLLAAGIRTTIAIGSCARVKDLLTQGKTRVQGYFFYPLNGLAYFDLEDIVVETLKSSCSLKIIYGEHDPGCLEETSRVLIDKAAEVKRPLGLTILPGLGHEFSAIVKNQIAEFLARPTN